MASTDVQAKEVSPLGNHPHYISQQPIDRHFIEIGDTNKSVFINAGIDSTCGRKRASIVHKFMNGTIIPLTTTSSASMPVDSLLDSLTLNHPAELESDAELSMPVHESDVHLPECCSHCGK